MTHNTNHSKEEDILYVCSVFSCFNLKRKDNAYCDIHAGKSSTDSKGINMPKKDYIKLANEVADIVDSEHTDSKEEPNPTKSCSLEPSTDSEVDKQLDELLYGFADYIKHHERTGLGGENNQHVTKQALKKLLASQSNALLSELETKVGEMDFVSWDDQADVLELIANTRSKHE